jgi:hypothetical protein
MLCYLPSQAVAAACSVTTVMMRMSYIIFMISLHLRTHYVVLSIKQERSRQLTPNNKLALLGNVMQEKIILMRDLLIAF